MLRKSCCYLALIFVSCITFNTAQATPGCWFCAIAFLIKSLSAYSYKLTLQTIVLESTAIVCTHAHAASHAFKALPQKRIQCNADREMIRAHHANRNCIKGASRDYQPGCHAHGHAEAHVRISELAQD